MWAQVKWLSISSCCGPSQALASSVAYVFIQLLRKNQSFLNGGQDHQEIRIIFRKIGYERADILVVAEFGLMILLHRSLAL
jgi:hypothetical protein